MDNSKTILFAILVLYLSPILMVKVPGYLGCYEDDVDRVLPDAQVNDDKMTIKMCKDFCINQSPTMRYAGVEYSTQCFCGIKNSYARIGEKSEDDCDMTCGGNSDELCGGTWLISVYDLAVICEQPSLPNGMIIGNDISFGNWVIFTCDSNYELIGDSNLQCVLGDTQSEISWSGDIPICQKSDYNSCPDDWIASEDFCYFMSDDKLDYEKARSSCNATGADLTSILTMNEQDLHSAILTLLVKERIWIGLDDREVENIFAWTDGSEVSFTNWAPDEPNDVDGEDCAHLIPTGDRSGKWNDVGCDAAFKYICKKPKESLLQETTTPPTDEQTTKSSTTEDKMLTEKGQTSTAFIPLETTHKVPSITYEPRPTVNATVGAENTQRRNSQTGVIAGSVVGFLLILLLVVILLFFLVKPRLQKQAKPTNTTLVANALYDQTVNATDLNNDQQLKDVTIYNNQQQPEYAYVDPTTMSQSDVNKDKIPKIAPEGENYIYADVNDSDKNNQQNNTLCSNEQQPEYAYVDSKNISQPDKKDNIHKSAPEDENYITVYADAKDVNKDTQSQQQQQENAIYNEQQQPEYTYVDSTNLPQSGKKGNISKSATEDNNYITVYADANDNNKNIPNGRQQQHNEIVNEQQQPDYAYVDPSTLSQPGKKGQISKSIPGDDKYVKGQQQQGNVVNSNQQQPAYDYVDSNHPSQPDKKGNVPVSGLGDNYYISVYGDANDKNHINQKHNPSQSNNVKADTPENSLYYATSDNFPRPINNRQQVFADDHGEGWEDNVAYSSFDSNVNNEEGWEENTLYSTNN